MHKTEVAQKIVIIAPKERMPQQTFLTISLKSEDEILEEAKLAYESGAFRYCMVSSGRGPKAKRITQMSDTIKKIKEKYPIEVCLSTGFIDENMAKELKDAGLDRLNHNLNTSETHYPKICTTHTYQDRMNTLLQQKVLT